MTVQEVTKCGHYEKKLMNCQLCSINMKEKLCVVTDLFADVCAQGEPLSVNYGERRRVTNIRISCVAAGVAVKRQTVPLQANKCKEISLHNPELQIIKQASLSLSQKPNQQIHVHLLCVHVCMCCTLEEGGVSSLVPEGKAVLRFVEFPLTEHYFIIKCFGL